MINDNIFIEEKHSIDIPHVEYRSRGANCIVPSCKVTGLLVSRREGTKDFFLSGEHTEERMENMARYIRKNKLTQLDWSEWVKIEKSI